MERTVLITGASSGIGWATAQLLADNKFNLIICGRRIEKLEKLALVLSQKVKVHVLHFDVRSKSSVYSAVKSLPEDFKNISILINNAGNAHGADPIQEGNDEDWDKMIDANVKGLLYVSKAVISGMVERKAGHIINISSIAGKEVYINGNVYCASKHAVDALTKGMRLDLNQYGIKVTSINPGMVKTEFSLVRYKDHANRADKVYEGMEPLTPYDIAETILFTITRPDRMVLTDITILPRAQASATLINRNLN